MRRSTVLSQYLHGSYKRYYILHILLLKTQNQYQNQVSIGGRYEKIHHNVNINISSGIINIRVYVGDNKRYHRPQFKKLHIIQLRLLGFIRHTLQLLHQSPTRCQCYKTFCVRNLRIFVKS
jgi:hypothetical protein